MNKYRNKITLLDGIKFRSQREAVRYAELKLLERAKKIMKLECQPKFPLLVNGEKVCIYIADFRYETKDKNRVVEDVKGMRTALYLIKKKLLKACYGIDVIEV